MWRIGFPINKFNLCRELTWPWSWGWRSSNQTEICRNLGARNSILTNRVTIICWIIGPKYIMLTIRTGRSDRETFVVKFSHRVWTCILPNVGHESGRWINLMNLHWTCTIVVTPGPYIASRGIICKWHDCSNLCPRWWGDSELIITKPAGIRIKN